MTQESNGKLERKSKELFERHLLECEIEKKRVDASIEHSVHERLKKHKQWLDSNGQDGMRFQAVNEDFTGIDFSHRDLRASEFKSCVLDYCYFYNVKLGDSATFWKCSIKKSLLMHADFEKTQFIECEIMDSYFWNAQFLNTYVTGIYNNDPTSEITNNDFRECSFDGTVFDNFSFYGAIIDDASFENVKFNICNLSFVDFTKTNINSSLTLYKCKSVYIKLSGMMLEGSNFIDCDLTNAQFENVLAKESDFSKSNLTRSIFRNADLAKSRFNMTTGNDIKFYGSDLNNSEMRLSSFRDSNFFKSKLYEADLSGSDLLNALIDKTTNKNMTNFSGCTWINGNRCKAASIGICFEEE